MTKLLGSPPSTEADHSEVLHRLHHLRDLDGSR